MFLSYFHALLRHGIRRSRVHAMQWKCECSYCKMGQKPSKTKEEEEKLVSKLCNIGSHRQGKKECITDTHKLKKKTMHHPTHNRPAATSHNEWDHQSQTSRGNENALYLSMSFLCVCLKTCKPWQYINSHHTSIEKHTKHMFQAS